MSESNYEKCHVSYRGRMEHEINTARDILQKHKKPCAAAVRELCDETDLSLHESCSMIRCLWRDAKLERLEVENARLKRDLEDQGAYDQYLRDRLNQENDLRLAAEAEKTKLCELVEDMLNYIEIHAALGKPPTSEMYEEFAQRANKLGIEEDI